MIHTILQTSTKLVYDGFQNDEIKCWLHGLHTKEVETILGKGSARFATKVEVYFVAAHLC